jgi:hypothetical protein
MDAGSTLPFSESIDFSASVGGNLTTGRIAVTPVNHGAQIMILQGIINGASSASSFITFFSREGSPFRTGINRVII